MSQAEQGSEKPRRTSRTLRYQSNWISLYTDRVQFPTGKIVEHFHVLEFGAEAAGALVLNDADEVLLARVYRYPTDSIEWELPGGRIDPGETPVETAQREAFEETGWRTADAKLLCSFHPINGISAQRFHVVQCRAVEQSGEFDPGEVQSIRWFSRNEIRSMIADQSLNDGFTLTGLLLWLSEIQSSK